MKRLRVALGRLPEELRYAVRVDLYGGSDDVRVTDRRTGRSVYGTLANLEKLVRQLRKEEA